jgi:hypothetical protein
MCEKKYEDKLVRVYEDEGPVWEKKDKVRICYKLIR